MQGAYDIAVAQLEPCRFAFQAYERAENGDDLYGAYDAAAKAKERCGEIHLQMQNQLESESIEIQTAFRGAVTITCAQAEKDATAAWTQVMKMIDGDSAPSSVHAARELYADAKASLNSCGMDLQSAAKKIGADISRRPIF